MNLNKKLTIKKIILKNQRKIQLKNKKVDILVNMKRDFIIILVEIDTITGTRTIF